MEKEDHDQEQTLALADEAAAEENQNQQVNRSLHLKLKMPTKGTDYHHRHQFMEEEEEQQQQQHRDVLRTCSECGKFFTSGKALGGHKRACLQKIKNHNSGYTSNPKAKIKNAVAGDNNDDDEKNGNICYVCHQSFRSVKSLYGHMRKHPEREWRGVQPPKRLLMNPHPHQSASAAASFSPTRIISDNDDSMGSGGDFVQSLKGWSAKRKRGRRSLSSSSEDNSDQDAEAMRQAVNDLLLLAQLSASDCAAMSKMNNNNPKRVIDDNEEDQYDEGDQKNVNVDEMEDDGLGFDDCDSEATWIVKEDYDDDDDDDDSEEIETTTMNQQKNNKKRKLNELDDATIKEEPMEMLAPTTTPQTYSCPICNKAFDKHQALGGHVASHNKNKNVKESSSASATTAAEDSKAEQVVAVPAAASEEETGESSAAAAVATAGSSEHKCNLCNKTFATGQALGGHKRCHWTGPAEAFSNSSQVTTSAGEVTQTAPCSPRVVNDFDLNDTPPEYYQFHGIEAASATTFS